MSDRPTQSEFNEALAKLQRNYDKLNEKQVASAVREFMRLRFELLEMIDEYATDNEIQRRRLNALLRELDVYEKSVREHSEITFAKIIEDTAKWTTTELASAGLTVGTSFAFINEHVVKYEMNRKWSDGLILSDRVWNLSGDLRDELSKVIRSAVIRGDSVSKLTTAIKQVHDNETWKVRRVAISESNNAHRAATLYNGQKSDIVTAFKLIDHPGHKNHKNHACYPLAHADDYGLGPGVYPKDIPADLFAKLTSPHPQCTSRLQYVLSEEV